MMSGIHEGKKEEEENTVELLRNLVSSDDEETNVPQVPVELEQGGAAEEAGLAAQVGPVHRSEERPTWGKAPPGQRSEDYDDDDDEEKMEQDFYPDLAKLQREAYNSHVGYDKVKREITKRSEQLTALRKDHFNILEREHGRVEEARNALMKVIDEQFREGRHLSDVFSTQALILQKERDIISKQFYLGKMARDHEQDEANLLFHLEEHRIKARILDNQFTAEECGVPLGPEPEAALKRRREVRDAFFSEIMKAPEAKRAKVDSSENPSANTAELPSDLSHAPGHTHEDIDQLVALLPLHGLVSIDKLFAKIGDNLVQVPIDGGDQQAQGLP